ncbi:MAG: hypothetical protein JSR26_04040 [Proteobacteria bacterium]|nr:hypothetical protein [Pseudomonadota bacterium]
MGWREDERTDWEEVLGNLKRIAESLPDQHQRLLRYFRGLEHLVAVLASELPPERLLPLAQALASDADVLADADEAAEPLRRLAAVLQSRQGSAPAPEEPHKSLSRGFHFLPELRRLR